MSLTLYGIPHCSTVKKARLWLAEHAIPATFYDFKKQGVTEALLTAWLAQGGTLDTLLNRRGTTWRGLSPADQALAAQPEKALTLLCTYPSLIKRPVLTDGVTLTIGFSEAAYAGRFAAVA